MKPIVLIGISLFLVFYLTMCTNNEPVKPSTQRQTTPVVEQPAPSFPAKVVQSPEPVTFQEPIFSPIPAPQPKTEPIGSNAPPLPKPPADPRSPDRSTARSGT